MAFDGIQTAKQQLADALQILERDGWRTGARIGMDGRRCALGAMDAVKGEMATFQDRAVVLLAEATGELYLCQADYQVAKFNNLQGSFDSVKAWFDRAMALA